MGAQLRSVEDAAHKSEESRKSPSGGRLFVASGQELLCFGVQQMNESTSRDLISRYLLGSLSEPEAQRVAEDCFMNEENLTLLENTEEELIERYVCGHLNSGDRKLFEDNFLVTEERRTAV